VIGAGQPRGSLRREPVNIAPIGVCSCECRKLKKKKRAALEAALFSKIIKTVENVGT